MHNVPLLMQSIPISTSVTDGRSVVVTRYTSGGNAASLYYSSGSAFVSSDGEGQYRMAKHSKRQHCHILASEPLTENRDDWIAVPPNHLVVITPQSNLLLERIPIIAAAAEQQTLPVVQPSDLQTAPLTI
jgi:predicted glutamine amidotransferase